MSEPLTAEQIEQNIATARAYMEDVALSSRERAWVMEQDGLTLGEGKERLYTGGSAEWVAPKAHPVWADAMRHETHVLRGMAEISNTRREWEVDYDKWPVADPTNRHFGVDLTDPEEYRRYNLTLDERHAEHGARWQGIAARLAAMQARLDAYFVKHPYSAEQSQAFLERERQQEQALDSLKTTAAIQLQHSTYAEISEAYVRNNPGAWQSRFFDPQIAVAAVEREETIRQGEGQSR